MQSTVLRESSLWNPRKKLVCPSFVLREIKILGHLFFKHWNAGNIQDQESDGEGPDYAKPAARNAHRQQPNTPPLDDLSEIVGVSGIPPKPALQYLAPMTRISCEPRKFRISGRLKHEPK